MKPKTIGGRSGAIYRDGNKYLNGQTIPSVGYREFPSSNGHTRYGTFAYADGTFSCVCNGWLIEKKDKKTKEKLPRTCTHVKEMALPGGYTPFEGEPGPRRINLNA